MSIGWNSIERRNSRQFRPGIRIPRWLRAYRAPAERAGRVRMEPHINTLKMESVVALGQQPSRLTVGELGEADGALEALLEVRRSVDGDGESFQQLGVEAAVRQGADIGSGEDKVGAGAAEGRVGAPVALGVEIEKDDEDDDHEQEDDCCYQDLAAYRHASSAAAVAARRRLARLRHR